MYLVRLRKDHNDSKGIVIHSPHIDDVKLSSGQINFVLGAVFSFDFTMNLNNPAWSRIEPLKTLIEVTDTHSKEVIFEGRVLQPRSRMNPDGSFVRQVTCESLLSYLVDSSQRHAEIHDTTIRDFMQIMLDNHNRQVEPHKQFKLGNVTVTNSTDNIYRYLGYENTYETIKDKLVKREGGYLQVRRESDGLYLDYLESVGEYVASTPIKLSKNMQSVDYEVDPTEIITRLVPLGASIESENEEDTDASQARLTIASENDGVDYLDDLDLQTVFGIIEKSVTWDGVTTAQRLKANGLNYLRDQKAAIARFDVNSTNSYLLGKDIASFELGNYHDLINPIISLNEKVQIIEKSIDINQPQKSSLKIGDKFRTLTEYQIGMKDTKKEVTELKNAVTNQMKRIATIQTELNNVDDALEDLNNALTDADIPALEDAIGNLNQAVSDLMDAIDNIPDYNPATQTKNGLMSALDKVKLDGLKSYELVTDLDDGLMSASDKVKLDLISVADTIDLDDVLSRLEALENA